MKSRRVAGIPLNFVLPIAAAALVIGFALGLGLLLLEINNQIGEPEALATALGVTIVIMGVAIYLTMRAEDAG